MSFIVEKCISPLARNNHWKRTRGEFSHFKLDWLEKCETINYPAQLLLSIHLRWARGPQLRQPLLHQLPTTTILMTPPGWQSFNFYPIQNHSKAFAGTLIPNQSLTGNLLHVTCTLSLVFSLSLSHYISPIDKETSVEIARLLIFI